MTDTDPWDDFAKRTLPTPDYVYRRRRLALLVILLAIVLLASLDLPALGAIAETSPDPFVNQTQTP